jgi:hypothetical protein
MQMEQRHKLGQHQSPLLRKLQLLSDGVPVLDCLRQLAVDRGCRHYEGAFEPPEILPEGYTALSNEELAVGLCLGYFDDYLLNIRMAAEIVAKEGVSPRRLALLATQERCNATFAYIATAGQRVEPTNPFWNDVLGHLPKRLFGHRLSFPHWTRFVSMTGVSRDGAKHVEWLRPCVLR